MNLTADQQKELKLIMGDGYRAGPFSGMVFNAAWAACESSRNKNGQWPETGEQAFYLEQATKMAIDNQIALKEAAGLRVKPQ